MVVSEDESKYPGIVIKTASTGRAYDVVKNIDTKVMKSKKGINEVLGKLDKVFKEDIRMEQMEKAIEFFKIKKKREEENVSIF